MGESPDPEEQARESIDTDLEEAGWEDLDETSGDTGYKTEYPTASGPVDYALLLDGTPVGVIEAKEAQKDAYAALPQAKRYAEEGIIQNGDLPDRWRWEQLEDLGEVHTGSTSRRSTDEYWEGGTIPWVSPKDMKTNRIRETEDYMTDTALEETTSNILPKGSILLVTRSRILVHSLPVAIAEVDLTINQDLKALVPADDVDSEYLLYCLQAFEEEIPLPGGVVTRVACSRKAPAPRQNQAFRCCPWYLRGPRVDHMRRATNRT